MPTYNFRNKKTGEITEHYMSVSSRTEFLKKNKHLEPYIDSAPGFNYNTGGDFGGKQTDNTWKEVLSKIAEQNPTSNLAETYGKKTIKQIKTQKVLDRHKKRMAAAANQKA